MKWTLLCAALAAAPAGALTPKAIYEKDAPSVVLILAASPEGHGELGTGSVIDAEGRVLTNAHVVVNAETGKPYAQIRVYLKPARLTGDRREDLRDPISATVERYDRGLDLALLDLKENPRRPPIALGDDASVSPGDSVVAIGHPEQGGFWTLTQGVVSTVIAGLGGVPGKDAFQTDASINRGNSGGPLLDGDGTMIGINTAMARKASDGLAITSVNFSIKSSVARRWLAGEAPPPPTVAKAPATRPQPVAAVPAPTPAPPLTVKAKPAILTPVKPYNADEVLAAEMAEMDQLGDEMQAEIERRAHR